MQTTTETPVSIGLINAPKRNSDVKNGKATVENSTLKEQEIVIGQLNRIIEIFKNSEGEIRPHFILTGPSGSGKSYTAQFLAQDHSLNFIEINAAQLTKEGTTTMKRQCG